MRSPKHGGTTIPRPIKTLKIRGVTYHLKWRRPVCNRHTGPCGGECQDPRYKGRKFLHVGVSGKGRTEMHILHTIIHEVLHGAIWDFDESAIGEISEDIANFLIRCGISVEFKSKIQYGPVIRRGVPKKPRQKKHVR